MRIDTQIGLGLAAVVIIAAIIWLAGCCHCPGSGASPSVADAAGELVGEARRYQKRG